MGATVSGHGRRPAHAPEQRGRGRGEAAWDHTYRTLLLENHLPASERTPAFIELRQRRLAHLSVQKAVMTRGPWEPELPYVASGIFG